MTRAIFAACTAPCVVIESIRVVSTMCYPDTSGGRQLRMTPSEAILEAVKAGEEQKVRAMLQADPALAGAHGLAGESAILMAAYRGRSDLVELLLAAGPVLDIFEASATGQADRVRSLLASEPGLANAAATDGFTPLGLASFFGHAEVTALLLARGAEVNAPSKNEMSVMPVNSAAAARHTAVVKLLLDHGADPNARQRSAFTPLHSAAHNGQIDMAELLLDRGADIHARSDEGLTPLRLALDRGRTAVAELLRARGAAE
jgi:ankyrin repeat protein